jgi:PPM family protein phosphatase
MLTTTYAGLSDVGRQRKRNDDRWGADPAYGLYIVADGVGSTKHGDVAAELVVETLPTYVVRHFEGADPHDRQLSARLGNAVVEMCSALHARSQTDSNLAGAGTTLVTAVISDSRAVIAHLGDSRAYLFRAGQVQRLTSDHTIVQAVMDAGGLSEEEAKRHPNRSIVVRHVLMTPPAKPDVSEVDLQPGDRILLCSDGLSGVVDDATLTAVLGEHPDPAGACQALIASANDAGGPDNITAVVIDAGGTAVSAPAPTAQPTVAGPVPSVPTAQPTVASPMPPVPAAQPTTAAPIPPVPAAQPTMAGPVPPVSPPPPPPLPPQQPPVPPGPPAGRVPPRTVIPPPQPPSPGRHRGLKWALAGLVVVLLAAAGAGYVLWPRQTASQTHPGQTTKPSTQAPPTPSAQTGQPNPSLGPQSGLPFKDLKHVKAVAVDGAGNVYALAVKTDKTVVVVKLDASRTEPGELQFGELTDATGIAVDRSGKNVYVTDGRHGGRLMMWTEGSGEAAEAPLLTSGDFKLKKPRGVAVDAKGEYIYVADTGNNRILRLAANPARDAASPTKLPFSVREPIGVAVDAKGDVFVVDQGKSDQGTGQGKNRLLKLPAGSETQEELSVTDLDDPTGLGANAAGDVYITDRHDQQVLKVSVGSNKPTSLPFTGLSKPTGVAVDDKGNIYVCDDDEGKVVTAREG